MKILIIGARPRIGVPLAETGEDRGEHYRRAFAAMGHDTRVFYHRDRVLEQSLPGLRRLAGKVARRVGAANPLDAQNHADAELLGIARDYRPDALFVFKGDSLRPEILRALRTDCGIVHRWNMFPDNPFLYDDVIRALPEYTAFFVKDSFVLAQLRALGAAHAQYLAQCGDGIAPDPARWTADDCRVYGAPVTLIGQLYPQRVRLLEQIVDFSPRIWGPPSEALLPAGHPLRPLHLGRPLFGEERAKAFALSAVALNTHHPLNDLHGINARNFDIATAGGLLMTNAQADLARHFIPGEECVTYDSIGDLREKIRHYFAHPEERAAIARRGQERALCEHTYEHRVREILKLTTDEHR